MNKEIKIAFDCDGVCLNFGESFIQHCKNLDVHLTVDKVWNFFDQDIRSYDIFKNLDNNFWLNLKREKASLDLSIIPVAYISHRTCPIEVTKQSLLNAGFPEAPVFHVKYTEDKLKVAKNLGVNCFIDDRASTVTYFLENGIDARLLTQIWNDQYNLPRVKTLGELK